MDRAAMAASGGASKFNFESKQMAMRMGLNMMVVDPKFQQQVEEGAAQLEKLLANPQFLEETKTVARRMKKVLADPNFKGQANLPIELRKAQVTQQHGVQSLLQHNPQSAFAFGGAAGRISTSNSLRSPAARSETRMQENASMAPKFDVKDLAGITAPLGFFDPVGFSADETEGKIRFYREVELKHGRLGMLASLGFLVGENFHPLFGGDIDVPAYLAFQQTPLQTFWPVVVFIISILEVFSVFTFESPLGGQPWTIRLDHEPGDLGFDPLGLKPTDPKELKEMQTKELNNGRLAMLAAAGMIAQEFTTGEKLF
jgi:hypothetical protein